MIDEELYQQAADELNSDRRRPHIWARACALASDDHDEARYLYTNLRVEELLSERAKELEQPIDPGVIETDSTLALMPIEEEDVDDKNEDMGFLNNMELMSGDNDIPSAISAPSGQDQGESARFENLEINMDPDEHIESVTVGTDDIIDELIEPDPDLMADYVPESDVLLDDTYADDGLGTGGLPEEEFAKEFDTFAEELDDTADASDLGSLVGADPVESSDFDLDSTTSLNLSADDIAQIQSQGSNLDTDIDNSQSRPSFDDTVGDFTDVDIDDLTQSNIDVLDANTNELDAMLEDARYKPAESQPSDPDLEWIEEDSMALDEAQEPMEAREPTIIEPDPLTDELSRQADEMELTDIADQTAVFSQPPESQPTETLQTEPEPVELDPVANDYLSDDDFTAPEPTPAQEPAQTEVTEAAEAAEAATAATAAAAMVAASPDLSSAGAHIQHTDQALDSQGYPLDLTEGRKGTLYSIYQRNNHAQAVKSGVSWSALLMTLPFLIYRQLFGTALAYIVLWVVAIGGLVVSGLAWLDAGVNVTPLIQTSTIGFALTAFIGLIYLPFRYANSWRGEKLENRGFELVAFAKAKNPGRAIASMRGHTASNN